MYLVKDLGRLGRRKFLGTTVAGACGAALMVAVAGTEMFVLEGCAITLNDVLNWTDIGTSAVGSVLTFLTAAGIVCALCGVAATAAIAAIHAIADAIRQWQAAAPADKATLWGKIHTALTIALSEVGKFFQEINLPLGKLAGMILGIASLVLSAITGFIQKFFPSLLAASSRSYKLGATTDIPVAPKEYHTNDFKKEYNKIVISGGHPEAVMN